MNRSLLLTLLAALLLSACGQVTPRPTLAPTLTVTPKPAATPTPRPTLTPTPTRVPNCPASNPKAEWVAPPDFGGYPGAIGAFLNAGGSADALRTILKNASAINDQFGGVWSRDLTGDGDLDTIVSLVN